ncbi:hypothetical protein B0H17DRAFT_1274430 [Mycena rosella]|uniref:Uncharacterized protein n=1 Tax=Mycena rosella TaxID=1033263 RepID=A0AAD7DNR9_MYCRO|nr:hypothetical protein B0H17DRAFT_1274430 [Mycena rosella]
MSALFTPLKLGSITIPNRIVGQADSHLPVRVHGREGGGFGVAVTMETGVGPRMGAEAITAGARESWVVGGGNHNRCLGSLNGNGVRMGYPKRGCFSLLCVSMQTVAQFQFVSLPLFQQMGTMKTGAGAGETAAVGTGTGPSTGATEMMMSAMTAVGGEIFS